MIYLLIIGWVITFIVWLHFVKKINRKYYSCSNCKNYDWYNKPTRCKELETEIVEGSNFKCSLFSKGYSVNNFEQIFMLTLVLIGFNPIFYLMVYYLDSYR